MKRNILSIFIVLFLVTLLPIKSQAVTYQDIRSNLRKVAATVTQAFGKLKVTKKLNLTGSAYIYNKKGAVKIKDKLNVTKRALFKKNINVKGSIKNTTSNSPLEIDDNLLVTGNTELQGDLTLPDEAVTADMLSGSIAYSKLSLSNSVTNDDLAGSIAYSKLSLASSVTNDDLAGSIAYSKLSLSNSVTSDDLAGSISDTKLSTISTAGKIADAALPAEVALSDEAVTIIGNWVNTANAWADNEVVNALTISGGTINNSTIGATTASTVNTTNLTINSEARGLDSLLQVSKASAVTTVDGTSGVGMYAAATIGTDGYPIISYFDEGANYNLVVIHCTSIDCSTADTPVTLDTTGNVGHYTSIAIGSDGYPVISYRDDTNGYLKVAHCGNTACSSGNTVATVDDTANVGFYSSITINTDGYPIISYYDSDVSSLKAVDCATVGCSGTPTISTVDNNADTGQYSSIAIGADGYPIISYFDGTANDDLRITHCDAADCSSSDFNTSVDSVGVVGKYTSITVPPDGQPVISYFDETNGALKVFKCNSKTCVAGVATEVDGGPDAGEYSSITIGRDGLPIISYFDDTNNKLKVYRCGEGDCTSGQATTVDNSTNVGQYTSITIGADGNPFIAYYDPGNATLKAIKAANQFFVDYWTRR